MKTDYESGNFVGKAEDSAYIIIRNLFRVEQRKRREWPTPGIYTQIPNSYLLSSDDWQDLASLHKKGSADIVVIPYAGRIIIVRVQGKKGDLKLFREGVQARLFKNFGCQVVDIDIKECKELFKERVNEKSIQEVIDSFKTAKVELPKRKEAIENSL